MECPNINRNFSPDSYNKPVNYKDFGGDVNYIYYEHDNGFGEKSLVQFCRLCGRKRDIFECLNESEWKSCDHFRSSTSPNIKNQEAEPEVKE